MSDAASTEVLTELPAEREAQLPAIRDKWISIGIATEPANRPEAEKAVRKAYELARQPLPSYYVWFDSPFEGTAAAMVIHKSPISDMLTPAYWAKAAAAACKK